MGLEGGGGDFTTAAAGAGAALLFGDLDGLPRQLGDLMPGRLGVVGASLGGQRRLAASAMRGNQDVEVMDAVGRQALTQGGRRAGLASGLFAGRLLDDGSGGRGRVGGGGQGGVGTIQAEAGLKFTDRRLQSGDPALQFPTALALWLPHASSIPKQPPVSCASSNRLNGYSTLKRVIDEVGESILDG
jgi:hypothetical protein